MPDTLLTNSRVVAAYREKTPGSAELAEQAAQALPSGIAHDSGLTVRQVTGYIHAHPQFFERSALSLGGTYGFRPVFPHPGPSKPRLRPFA